MERELSLSLVFLVCLPTPVAGEITGRFAVGFLLGVQAPGSAVAGKGTVQSLHTLNDQISHFIVTKSKALEEDQDPFLPAEKETLKSSMILMRHLLMDAQDLGYGAAKEVLYSTDPRPLARPDSASAVPAWNVASPGSGWGAYRLRNLARSSLVQRPLKVLAIQTRWLVGMRPLLPWSSWQRTILQKSKHSCPLDLISQNCIKAAFERATCGAGGSVRACMEMR
ncbi:hypothetical protein Celaphus_00011102 [Cervus elaphus hippelaphus]|uniref:Uncharacterized protein n=1 Tax=Cervus elaphus hippelaphus TaxID=46360 RepID=A0A212CQ88_CEREH|nr:hypothetical protein Celaphus_00011102 [Cervus elaphus hippelaphus]